MIEDINKTKLINFQNPGIGTETIQSNRVKFTNLVHISPVWLLRKQIKPERKNLIYLKLTEMNITYFEQKRSNQIAYFEQSRIYK